MRALVMVAGPATMSNLPASRPGSTLGHGRSRKVTFTPSSLPISGEQFLVEAGLLAVLDEVERRELQLGADGELALGLHLGEQVFGMGGAGQRERGGKAERGGAAARRQRRVTMCIGLSCSPFRCLPAGDRSILLKRRLSIDISLLSTQRDACPFFGRGHEAGAGVFRIGAGKQLAQDLPEGGSSLPQASQAGSR